MSRDSLFWENYVREHPELSAVGFEYIDVSWRDALADIFDSKDFLEICKYVAKEREQADFNKCHITPPTADQISNPVERSKYLANFNSLPAENKFISVHPAPKDVFAWTAYGPPKDVKVVIVGQDPYPDANAHGLCFSADEMTSSLRNIFKVLAKNKPSFSRPPDIFNLRGWARQGVLLLNSMLTVRGNIDPLGSVIKDGGPTSHRDAGWEKVTDAVIKYISVKNEKVVFMLWGVYAETKRSLINVHTSELKEHLVPERTSHPSPLSSYLGFDKCRHFAEADGFWSIKSIPAVNWSRFDQF